VHREQRWKNKELHDAVDLVFALELAVLQHRPDRLLAMLLLRDADRPRLADCACCYNSRATPILQSGRFNFSAGVAGMLTVAAEFATLLVRMRRTLAHRLKCFPWEACGDRMLRLL
jgi:hypothetical protein